MMLIHRIGTGTDEDDIVWIDFPYLLLKFFVISSCSNKNIHIIFNFDVFFSGTHDIIYFHSATVQQWISNTLVHVVNVSIDFISLLGPRDGYNIMQTLKDKTDIKLLCINT
jgi:hypothetical protein